MFRKFDVLPRTARFWSVFAAIVALVAMSFPTASLASSDPIPGLGVATISAHSYPSILPVGGATVVVYRASGVVAVGKTDYTTGEVRFTLDPGNYSLTAMAKGYEGWSGNIAVTSGNNTTQDAVLWQTSMLGKISVHTMDAVTKTGLAGAHVSVRDNKNYEVAAGKTNGQGSFVAKVPANNYIVVIEKDKYVSQKVGLDVKAGQETQHDALLTPMTPPAPSLNKLVINVVDAMVGKPIVNANVVVASHDGHIVAHATTDKQGSVSFMVAPGQYEVTVSAQGYSSMTKGIAVDAGSAAKYEFALKTETPGTGTHR